VNSLLCIPRKGGPNASILYEVPCQERNQGPQKNHNEERQTGNSRRLPDLRHKSIQNRLELGLLLHSLTELRRAGFSRCRDIQSFCFTNHTLQANVTQQKTLKFNLITWQACRWSSESCKFVSEWADNVDLLEQRDLSVLHLRGTVEISHTEA